MTTQFGVGDKVTTATLSGVFGVLRHHDGRVDLTKDGIEQTLFATVDAELCTLVERASIQNGDTISTIINDEAEESVASKVTTTHATIMYRGLPTEVPLKDCTIVKKHCM